MSEEMNGVSGDWEHEDNFSTPGASTWNAKTFNAFKMSKLKQYGEDLILVTGKDSLPVFSFVPTGDPCLDSLLGGFGDNAGWPRGTFIEIAGEESSGKTTLMYEALASFARTFPDRGIAFIDMEGNFDSEYARHLGVPVDEERFVYSLPQNGKQALTLLDQLVRSGMFSCVALDSWAAISPPASADTNAEAGDGAIGWHALLSSKVLGRLATAYKAYDCTFITSNQMRVNITPMGARGTITTGGRAIRYYARLRLKILPIPGDGKENLRKVQIVKAQGAARAEDEVEISIKWGIGLDRVDSLITMGLAQKHIVAAGAWLQIPAIGLKVQGRNNLSENLRSDAGARASLCDLLGVAHFDARYPLSRKRKISFAEETTEKE